jgi:hypothetical protein
VGRIRRALRFAAEYWDLLLALVGAAVIAALGLTDVINKSDHLTEATLGVLAVLAFTQVRDRGRRDRLGESVEDALEATKAADTSFAWHFVSGETTRDLAGAPGGESQIVSKRTLRLMADDVVAVHEWATSDGEEISHDVKGCTTGGTLRELDVSEQLISGGPEGRKYRMIGLGEIGRIGQRFDLVTTRRVIGCFPKSNESAWIRIGRPTGDVRMRVIWPRGRAPTAVSAYKNGRLLQDAKKLLANAGNGRKKLEFLISEPEIGDAFEIRWDWKTDG